MSRRLLSLACSLALAVSLAGCWQAEEPKELPEESSVPVLEEEAEETPSFLPERFSLPYEQGRTLDPITCPDGMQQAVASLICEGLFRLDPNLEPEYCLCESYTYDPDRAAYTFALRQGVVFSDGTSLTASDVRACLERARSSERYASRLRKVTRISASEGAVTVTLSSSNTGFPALLDIPICKLGGDGIPLGTGPYFFSREEGGARLEANGLWWRGGGQPVENIFLEESQDAMLYRFTSRDVQLIAADLTGVEPVGVTGDVTYQDVDTTVFQYVGCNTARLANAALRRALYLGIDREELVGGLLSGHAVPVQFPVPAASALYPKSLERPYSQSAFAEALSESGYVPEGTLTLLVNEENAFKVSLARAIAQAFTEGGVPTEAVVLSWEEYTEALAAGKFDLYYGEVRLSADWDLSALLSAGEKLNVTGWADQRTEQLMASYAAASDRAAALSSLCAYLQAQAPLLPVCFKNSSVLSQAGVVEGLVSTALEPFYGLRQCTIHLRQP